MTTKVLSMTIKLPAHRENALDEKLLNTPGEEYFPAYLRKHQPNLIDDGAFTGELAADDFVRESTARYKNVRRRKQSGLKQAVRV
jgi:hypothetical protein